VGAIEINTDQWPVCFVKIDGEQTIEDFDGYIAAFNRFYERREPFAIVTFLKRYKAQTELVAKVGKWFKETEPLIAKYWVSNAMVSLSGGFRFLLSAVFLIRKPPNLYKVCASPDEALAFTRVSWKGKPLPSTLHWPWPE
jgi:hypothetical protein